MPHKFLVEYEKQGTRWTRVSTPSCSWEIRQKTNLSVFLQRYCSDGRKTRGNTATGTAAGRGRRNSPVASPVGVSPSQLGAGHLFSPKFPIRCLCQLPPSRASVLFPTAQSRYTHGVTPDAKGMFQQQAYNRLHF